MANGNNGTSGHEQELVDVQGLKATLEKGGNKGLYNEATCSTAAATPAKTVTAPASFSLVAGAKIVVKFTYAITVANATLQVGESTAKPIYYKGAALGANLVQAGSSILLHYDGTSFNIVGDLNTDTTYSVMGASGSTHSSGLVPDTPSTAGTTKFLREDGTWNEPEGSNYTAGDGIDISNGEISVDSTVALKTDLANEKQGNGIGACYTSSGTALTVSLTNYELVTNGFIAVTFEHDVPANATLNINGKGAKPIIYKGSAIEADTIKADDTVMFGYDGTNYVLISSGEGGGIAVLNEHLTIHLTTNQSSHSDIIGATVVVVDTEGSETLLDTTWDGTDIELDISPSIPYTITVGNVTDYSTPAAVSYISKVGNSRTASFTYNTEVVTVTCTSSDSEPVTGKKITIAGIEYTLTATGVVTAKVPFGSSYSIVGGAWSGYAAPSASYTAENATRSVSMQWTEIVLGVFIEATDKALYTSSTWPYTGKTANGVVVITSNCMVRVALSEMLIPLHKNNDDPLNNYLTPINIEASAKADYDGASNTAKIIQFNTAYGTNTTEYAAPYCAAYTFPDGVTKGYLPACGQMWAMYQNKTELKACLAACGGEDIFTSNYWYRTSTNYGTFSTNSARTWGVRSTDGNTSPWDAMTSSEKARPVSTFTF